MAVVVNVNTPGGGIGGAPGGPGGTYNPQQLADTVRKQIEAINRRNQVEMELERLGVALSNATKMRIAAEERAVKEAAQQQKLAQEKARRDAALPAGPSGMWSAQQLAGKANEIAATKARERQIEAELDRRGIEKSAARKEAEAKAEQDKAHRRQSLQHGLASGNLQGLMGGVAGAAGMGGPFAAIMGSMQLAQNGIESATKIINAGQNGGKSLYHRRREVDEMMPIIGSVNKQFNELADAVMGAAESMRKYRERVEEQNAIGAVTAQAGMERLGVMAPVDAAAVRARASVEIGSNNKAYDGDVYDDRARRRHGLLEATKPGIREASIDLRAAELTKQKLDADVKARQKDVMEQSDKVNARRRSFESVSKERDALGPAPANPFSKEWAEHNVKGQMLSRGVQGEAAKLQKEQNELIAKEAELKAQVQRQGQAGVDVEKARGALLAKNLEQERARLTFAQETAARMKGSAQAFGGANESQRVMALQAIHQWEKRGFSSLSQQQQQHAALIAGEAVQREQVKLGDMDPRMREAREALARMGHEDKADAAGGFAGKQREVDNLQTRIQNVADANATATNVAVSAAFKKFGADLSLVIKEALDTAIDKIRDAIAIKKAMGGQ